MRTTETVLVLRLSQDRSADGLTDALTTIRRVGGDVRLHVTQMDGEACVVRCVCEDPAGAALALEEQGVDAGLETAVWVEAEDRPGALGHLVASVEAAGVRVERSYGVSSGAQLRALLHTDDNPRAEDALRAYLDLRT